MGSQSEVSEHRFEPTHLTSESHDVRTELGVQQGINVYGNDEIHCGPHDLQRIHEPGLQCVRPRHQRPHSRHPDSRCATRMFTTEIVHEHGFEIKRKAQVFQWFSALPPPQKVLSS